MDTPEILCMLISKLPGNTRDWWNRNVEEKSGDAKDGDSEFKKVQCPVCDESCGLENCSIFKDQTLEERSKILWKKKLCYGCYSPVSQDHNAKTCKQRRTCKICKQFRPTGLQGYLPKKKRPKVTNDPKDDVLPIHNKKLMTSNFAEMNIKLDYRLSTFVWFQ